MCHKIHVSVILIYNDCRIATLDIIWLHMATTSMTAIESSMASGSMLEELVPKSRVTSVVRKWFEYKRSGFTTNYSNIEDVQEDFNNKKEQYNKPNQIFTF